MCYKACCPSGIDGWASVRMHASPWRPHQAIVLGQEGKIGLACEDWCSGLGRVGRECNGGLGLWRIQVVGRLVGELGLQEGVRPASSTLARAKQPGITLGCLYLHQ